MTLPRLSVVMPVYNGRLFLTAAIESVLSQTFTDLEFIIVNDGSTDGTSHVLRRYARQDERIRVINQENAGVSSSLNRGDRAARGVYIARMDADDVCMPSRLEQQMRHLETHPECVLVGGQVRLINAEGRPICNNSMPPSGPEGNMRRLVRTHQAIEDALLKQQWPLVHPAVMVRRQALLDIGGYNEWYRTNQDADLFLRLAEVGKLFNLDTTVLEYRRHGGQTTANRSSQWRLKLIRRHAFQRRGRSLPHELTHRGILKHIARSALKRRGWV